MEIDIREALEQNNVLFIDVRSPGEYYEASIPGAVNIPLFDDREYYQLSIIFYQMGEHEARRAALDMVAPRLPALVKSITKASGSKKPLLYCKRGGMRSLSLDQVLSLVGVPVYRLKNGYKAYRRYVNERLRGYNLKSKLYVLNGLTGVGKTLVLKKLEQRGVPVIDLEGLARHRGSVFGAVGFDKPRSQKDFDALLLEQLDQARSELYLVTEGEGQRIGNIYLPHFFVEAMKQGEHILLTAPFEVRVKRIVDTYVKAALGDEIQRQLESSLKSLERRLGKRKTEMLTAMIKKGNYYTVAELLCRDYYDHFYSDSRPGASRFTETIDATDLNQAADQVMAVIVQKFTAPA